MASARDHARGLGLPAETLARVREVLTDRSETGRGRRFAAAAFAARVANAALGFALNVLLARWLGEGQYGTYALAWSWLLVIGGLLSFGLPIAALKLVPDYRERGDPDGLRGFMSGCRTIAAVPSALVGLAAGGLFWTFSAELGPYWPVAAIAALVLPVYVVTDLQTGLARAWGLPVLGLAADYLVRPALLLGFAGALYAVGHKGEAAAAMWATLAAAGATALAQALPLGRRLSALVPPGPGRQDLDRWAVVAWPLLTVTGFTLLLGSADLLILPLFVGPEEVAIYFAATKIVAVASFVAYGVANTSAHRFAAQFARGDEVGLRRLATETVAWTFWPTLVVAGGLTAAAGPLLGLFGPSFTAGAPIVAILSAGLVAGASVGPADRALAMADHGRATAGIYGLSAVLNVALCFALTPLFGLVGSALGTALTLMVKAILLRRVASRRLGLDMGVWALSPGGTSR